ncbi:MAG: cytochrome c [Fuerstiella sp.]|nr:cytochrome c [Fuerstiella sp.]MCP4858187.1 cytochrome c [Fuerstiella sp.]
MKRSRSLSKTIFVGISVAYLAGAGCGKPPTPGTVAPKTTVADAKALHAKHCGACHGENGNGEGPGSRSLWPKARNFRRESFRLVSTKNQIPSVEDVETVIRRGMPGTSMKAFDTLSQNERIALAKHVLELQRAGLRETIIEQARTEQENIDDSVVQRIVDWRTTPSGRATLPEFGDSTADSIRRGRALYLQSGCPSCHGDDGVGRSKVYLYDESRRPTRARDLQHEPFKGGHGRISIALRIRLGMPGTPHPSSPLLSESQLVDLVHYCHSLSHEPKLDLTGFQRRSLATGQEYLKSLGRAAHQ